MANRIDDGLRTTICFTCPPAPNVGVVGAGSNPFNMPAGAFGTALPNNAIGNVVLFEKSVTPPGLDGGGANDVTTMRNKLVRTMSPKKLKTVTDLTAVVAYDPRLFPVMLGYIQVNQIIIVTWPDGSQVYFWGWVDKFIPGEAVEGTQPTATITIVPSNHDNFCPPNEQGPSYIDGSTSGCNTCAGAAVVNTGVCGAGMY